MKPLAVTMGEPHSISAYLTIESWKRQSCPLVYLGCERLIKEVNPSIPTQLIQDVAEASSIFKSVLPILPLQNKVYGSLKAHSEKDSAAVRESIKRSVALASNKQVAGVITCPIHKKSLQMGGMGQTEYIAQILQVKKCAMMAMKDDLRAVLVTTHVPVKEIQFTKQDIKDKIQITKDFLQSKLSIDRPRIAVLGLNPHAGEGGLMGDEDRNIILPACKELEALGPLPGDSVFQDYKKYDAIIAMYHDQGLAPFKALAKDGVNITIGLPIIRTSPIHGTACDLVGDLGKVNCNSFMNAVEVGYKLGNK